MRPLDGERGHVCTDGNHVLEIQTSAEGDFILQ